LDAPPLSESQRRNHFPASSYCTITWYLHGQALLLQQGETELRITLPGPIVFGGPRPEPVVTFNPGKVEFFMLVLLPEALHALTGLDIAAHTNRSSCFEQVFEDDWQDLAQAVLKASDDAERMELIEQFLEPRWGTARSRGGVGANWLRDYATGVALRITTASWTRSLRQLERQVKAWSGLSLQRLRGTRRAEQRYLAARNAVRTEGTSWADVAVDTGYADQAHFCRETRKMTGLTPNELKRRLMNEEGYWMYRIWS
jgi:hypothetical protein